MATFSAELCALLINMSAACACASSGIGKARRPGTANVLERSALRALVVSFDIPLLLAPLTPRAFVLLGPVLFPPEARALVLPRLLLR